VFTNLLKIIKCATWGSENCQKSGLHYLNGPKNILLKENCYILKIVDQKNENCVGGRFKKLYFTWKFERKKRN